MAKQTVNIGTSANKGNGDPLRTAFTKINNNFDELYSALGSDGDLFDPNSVDQSLVPTTTNTVDLGSASKQWRSLYVSNNTIYIGGVAIAVDNNGNLTTGGTVVGSTPAWANITGKPTFATVATTGAYADLTGKPTIPTSFDRLSNSGDEVILIGGANPYVTFPAITGGDQLQIQGAEVTAISGNLALTSFTDTNIISNGSGAAPGGSKSWNFAADGSMTIPGDIKSENAINIDINLADSTLRRWRFGEDGDLNLPQDGGIVFDRNNTTIRVGMGFHIASGEGISLDAIDQTAILTLSGAGNGPVNQTYNKTNDTLYTGNDNSSVTVENLGGTWFVFIDGDAKYTSNDLIGWALSTGPGPVPVGVFSNGYKIWGFSPTGNLTLPNGAVIRTDGTNTEVGGMTNFNVEAAGVVNIYTDDGAYQWQFGDDGSLTLPGDIRSETGINIDVNLSDSTLRRWRFGEDGNLDAPGIVSAAGLRTAETKIALGLDAGQTSQGGYAVAVGYAAGQTSQGVRAVSVGPDAGSTSQGIAGVAIGYGAGQISQGIAAIAIGNAAGGTGQGNSAIAIGVSAGVTSQAANSIVINASGAALNNTTASSFVVKPVRGVAEASLPSGFKPVAYNPTTGEFIYYDA